MNIIIPLGGLGTRFSKEGYNEPKPLIKVFNKEILFYLLDNLSYKKEDKIFIIYNKRLDKFNFNNRINDKYPEIDLIKLDNDTSGASETIMIGLKYILNNLEYNKKCILLDCDLFYTEDILSKFRNNNNNAVFYTLKENEKPVFSYIRMGEDNKILEIAEKIKISNNANTGAYCFSDINILYKYSCIVINNNIKFNNECYTSCIIHKMIEDKNIFEGIEVNEKKVFVLGTPNQLNEYISKSYLFLFDLDGTLVITDEIYIEIWKELLIDYNIHVDYDFFKKNIQGNNDLSVLNNLKLMDKINIDELSIKKDNLFEKNIDKIKIIDGVINFMNKIKQFGNKIGIVTNCNRKSAELIIQNIGVNKLIDKLIVSNECKNPKPYPDPYIEAINYFNFNFNKTIIFEDSKSGLLSANSTGVLKVYAITTIFSKEELKKMGFKYSIENYIDLDIKNLIKCDEDNYKEKLIKYICNSLDIENKNLVIHNGKLKGGYISDVISITFIKNNIEHNCVIKLENNNESKLSIMAEKLGLYEREYYFYENISKYVNIEIPIFYCLLKDNNLKNIGIILENMNKKNYEIGIDLNISSIDISLKIVEKIAKLHSKFWNKDLKIVFPCLLKNDNELFNPSWKNFVNENWDAFKIKWEFLLSTDQITIAENIIKNFDKIQSNLSKNNLTLTHGDVKSLNIFYDKDNNYEPYFIDWQYIANGKGTQDLVFFLIESFDIEFINNYLSILKLYYYKKILEYKVENYSYEEYEKDFIYSICYYPFFVGIWFGTTPDEDLIDKNFPFFYIQKLFNFISKNIDKDYVFN